MFKMLLKMRLGLEIEDWARQTLSRKVDSKLDMAMKLKFD